MGSCARCARRGAFASTAKKTPNGSRACAGHWTRAYPRREAARVALESAPSPDGLIDEARGRV